MKSFKLKNIGFFTALMAILFLSACGEKASETAAVDDAAQLRTQIDTANRLMFADQMEKAIAKLEGLLRDHPKNTEVLEALGFAYVKHKDYALAGFYFDQVLTTDPSRTDIALYAGKAHLQAENWEFAAAAYETFLKHNPNDFLAWKALAQANDQLGKIKPTLDAYLNAFSNADNAPNAEEAARMGTLFLRLNNFAQAAEWFRYAVDFTPKQVEYQIEGLLGLLEIAWNQQQWHQAQLLIQELDAVAPNALEQSALAYTRTQLEAFKTAQTDLEEKRRLNVIETLAATQESPPPDADAANTVTELATTELAPVPTTDSDDANTPVVTEVTADEPLTDTGGDNGFHKYPPMREDAATTISLEASPVAGDWDSDGDGGPDSDSDGSADSTGAVAADMLADGRISIDRESATAATASAVKPAQESRFATAKEYQAAGDYAMATRLFQDILVDNPDSSNACFELSRTYFLTGDWSAAELYASEAIRLDPGNVVYTINFLQCVQKRNNSERLLKELIRAKEKFPLSPEITLALAQVYDRVVANPRNARLLYGEFLELAPLAHPSRNEVETAINRLPRIPDSPSTPITFY